MVHSTLDPSLPILSESINCENEWSNPHYCCHRECEDKHTGLFKDLWRAVCKNRCDKNFQWDSAPSNSQRLMFNEVSEKQEDDANYDSTNSLSLM